MLVCSLGGRERVLAGYRKAVRAGYRFYSYGDCMLVWAPPPPCLAPGRHDRGTADRRRV